MTVISMAHRLISSWAEVALEATLGTRNWGAGPGFGPTA